MFYLFVFAVLTASELRALVEAKAKGTTPTPTGTPTQGEGSESVIPNSPAVVASPIVTQSITGGV